MEDSMTHTLKVRLKPETLAKWREFKAALDAAAMPYTGQTEFIVPFGGVEVLPEAQKELHAALMSVERPKDGKVYANFIWDGEPLISVRVSG